MSAILNILISLSSCLGNDVVREACQKFVSGKVEAVKVKKEHRPRGKSPWNLEVDKVLEEMRAISQEPEKITYKIAYAEASRKRRENNPDAQAKYDAYRLKMNEKRAAKKATKDAITAAAATPAAVASPAAAVPVVEEPVAEVPVVAPKKKVGRPAKA